MPVPVGPHVVLGELEDAVLLLPAAEAEQPAAVQLTLVPGVVPGVLHLGEQVLVTWLREQFINSPQSLLAIPSPCPLHGTALNHNSRSSSLPT